MIYKYIQLVPKSFLSTDPMPRTIEEGFSGFLGRLAPTPFESQAVKSHRASIESRLLNDFGLRRFYVSRHGDCTTTWKTPSTSCESFGRSSLMRPSSAIS
jgi:hypothetical protein